MIIWNTRLVQTILSCFVCFFCVISVLLLIYIAIHDLLHNRPSSAVSAMAGVIGFIKILVGLVHQKKNGNGSKKIIIPK